MNTLYESFIALMSSLVVAGAITLLVFGLG